MSYDKIQHRLDNAVNTLSKLNTEYLKVTGGVGPVNIGDAHKASAKGNNIHAKYVKVMNVANEFINTAQDLMEEMKDIDGEFEQEMYRNKLKEKAAERHRWKAYGHKLVRWLVSTIIALALYSGVNYLTDKACKNEKGKKELCIVVPIRDWIPDSQ